jgi:hypothetical protein
MKSDLLRSGILLSISLVLSLSFATAEVEQANISHEVGLSGGEPAPHFEARDQFGRDQTDKSVAGEHGTVLLFFRSADW